MEEEQKKVSGAAVLPKVGWKGMLALAFGILFFGEGWTFRSVPVIYVDM